MVRIALIGAGSVQFVKKLLADILGNRLIEEPVIALHDIDAERLETAGMMARWTADALNSNARIEEHSDRAGALAGAAYVISTVTIGGLEGIRADFEIPARYGLKQTVADTAGIGGISRGLRSIPFMLSLARDMERYCPDAFLLNYSNPLGMMTWPVFRHVPAIKVIGLCHSVEMAANDLALYLGLPRGEMSFLCGGINHMSFFLKLEHEGRDLYPALRAAAEDPAIFAKDRVRFELMKALGRFVTESSRHEAEYVPYFLRSDAEIERLRIPIALSLSLAERRERTYRADRQRLLAGQPFPIEKSLEYAADIITAIETGGEIEIYGNVENRGLVDNLPPGCCVEVPVRVDREGFHPLALGTLPAEVAAHCAPHVYVQELTIRAIAELDPELARRAAVLDRHAPSVLTLPEIRRLMDELFEAQRAFLPEAFLANR